MTLQTDLQNLGLKENEAIVYVAILTKGETTISVLEQATGLHKQVIYNMVDELTAKNLVHTHYEGRGKRFSVPNPAALEELTAQKLSSARIVTGELLKLANQGSAADTVNMFRAQTGVWHYYQQKIALQPSNTTVHILAQNSERYFDLFPLNSRAYTEYEAIRVRNKITLHGLVFDSKEKEATLNANRAFVTIKTSTLPVTSPHDLIIWETSVGLLFYTDEPYIIDINGKSTADGFRSYFKAIWNTN